MDRLPQRRSSWRSRCARAVVRTRPGARPPGRQAPERALERRRRREGDRLRDRAVARRPARHDPDRDGAGHVGLHRARAGAGAARRRALRRLLARGRAVRAADDQGAVPGRELRRGRDAPHQRATAFGQRRTPGRFAARRCRPAGCDGERADDRWPTMAAFCAGSRRVFASSSPRRTGRRSSFRRGRCDITSSGFHRGPCSRRSSPCWRSGQWSPPFVLTGHTPGGATGSPPAGGSASRRDHGVRPLRNGRRAR